MPSFAQFRPEPRLAPCGARRDQCERCWGLSLSAAGSRIGKANRVRKTQFEKEEKKNYRVGTSLWCVAVRRVTYAINAIGPKYTVIRKAVRLQPDDCHVSWKARATWRRRSRNILCRVWRPVAQCRRCSPNWCYVSVQRTRETSVYSVYATVCQLQVQSSGTSEWTFIVLRCLFDTNAYEETVRMITITRTHIFRITFNFQEDGWWRTWSEITRGALNYDTLSFFRSINRRIALFDLVFIFGHRTHGVWQSLDFPNEAQWRWQKFRKIPHALVTMVFLKLVNYRTGWS